MYRSDSEACPRPKSCAYAAECLNEKDDKFTTLFSNLNGVKKIHHSLVDPI